MPRQTWKKRTFALALALSVAAACVTPALAEPIGDGVAPTYDEAYYATLDYYGNLVEGSVVKSYALNGAESFTDYGAYDEVVNLTDRTPASVAGDKTAFRFDGGAPDHFYFEGKTRTPFDALPWTVTLRYTLNGVPAKAEDLAGQQGVVEILLDIVPNETASDYARYNYTLEAMAIFNQDDIVSLEAPGAQVQLVGNLRTALFLALPGEEQHFTIRVGSNDFSFGGMTILMVPATLAQLEEIAKLSERKDDLEDDYDALSGSLDALLDSLSSIQSGLYASASGLDQLEIARGTFSNSKGTLYEGADTLRGDLTDLAVLLEPVEERLKTLSLTVTSSTNILNELTDAVLNLQEQLVDVEKALKDLEAGTADVKHILDLAGDLEWSLLRLEDALGGTHISTDKVSTNSKALVEKVKNVHSAYAETDQTAFMEKMLVLNGSGTAEAKAQAAGLAKLLAADAAGLPVPADQQANLAKAKQLAGVHAAKGSISFQTFCGQLPGVTESQAKQMGDLWTIYSSGGNTSNVRPGNPDTEKPGTTPEKPDTKPENSGTTPENPDTKPENPDTKPENPGTTSENPDTKSENPGATPEKPETPPENTDTTLEQPETPAEADPADSQTPQEAPEASPETAPEENNRTSDSDTTEPAAEEAGETLTASLLHNDPADGGDSGTDTPTTPPSTETPEKPTTPPAQENTVGGAVIDLITGGLDSATARIDQIQNQVTRELEELKYPTSKVAGDLADLCGDLYLLFPMLDDAADLSAALRASSGLIREMLNSVDSLREELNAYEPTLQEALANAGTLSKSAVTTIQDTEALIANAESVLRTSGAELDKGTQQSLSGLAAALRQTARALATTKDVKDAKNTITDIIEDTWNEYTGDVNNLLLMDATAEPVSLTDERNPAPSSVQVLIRTQEIKEAEPEKEAEAEAVKAETTFWDRVVQMFRDFWQAITGIFR